MSVVIVSVFRPALARASAVSSVEVEKAASNAGDGGDNGSEAAWTEGASGATAVVVSRLSLALWVSKTSALLLSPPPAVLCDVLSVFDSSDTSTTGVVL